MNAEEGFKAIREAVFEGEVTEAKLAMEQVLAEKIDPARILGEALLPAIREAGESMEEGDFFMPEVKIFSIALKEAAQIIRPLVIPEERMSSYLVPPWTGEGDIDDIGAYLKAKIEDSLDLPPQEMMGVLDMVVAGLGTHEFTPCKIQAQEVVET